MIFAYTPNTRPGHEITRQLRFVKQTTWLSKLCDYDQKLNFRLKCSRAVCRPERPQSKAGRSFAGRA
jgi:hypothetical protein